MSSNIDEALNSVIEHTIHELSEILPNQGPLQIFIHHNTLHAFEGLKFFEGIEEAGRIYGANVYLTESTYLRHLASGRIDRQILKKHLKNAYLSLQSEGISYELFEAAFFAPLKVEHQSEFEWLVLDLAIEGQQPEQTRKLLELCYETFIELLSELDLNRRDVYKNFSDKLFGINAEDHLLKLCAAYYDHGLALERFENLASKSFTSFCFENFQKTGVPVDPSVAEKVQSLHPQNSAELLIELFKMVYGSHRNMLKPETFSKSLFRMALKYPGWAGCFARDGRLVDFLCALLLFKQACGLRFRAEDARSPNPCTLAGRLLFIAKEQVDVRLTLEAEEFDKLTSLIQLLYRLEENLRLRIFQKAYEDSLHASFLALFAVGREELTLTPKAESAKFSVVFCIDEREESFRRHLESECSDVATFGYAGFFGIDATLVEQDGHQHTICPPLVQPKHTVRVRSAVPKPRILRFKEALTERLYNLRATPLSAALLSLLTPVIAPAVVVSKLLTKNYDSASVYHREYEFEKSIANPQGYGLDDMAARIAAFLNTTGLLTRMGRYVIVAGHGAKGANNPYKSAYDCGACGGHPGDVNSLIFAQMANLSAVRERLKQQGICIPEETVFIGAYHNTTTDEFTLPKLDLYDSEVQSDLKLLIPLIQNAAKLNALERTRHFASMHGRQQILEQVKRRAYYIAEPRPEYGHATNALCVVGSRKISEDLFLDRRAFLVSYDPALDPESKILAGVMRAIVPVCMGINLEYYFSSVDNYRFGAGSKLPQNVVAGFATMTGSLGDLRTGLPKQMIEIHEPVRLAMLLDASREQIEKVLEFEPQLRAPIYNSWLRLFYINRADEKIQAFNSDDEFCLGLLASFADQDVGGEEIELGAQEHKLYRID